MNKSIATIVTALALVSQAHAKDRCTKQLEEYLVSDTSHDNKKTIERELVRYGARVTTDTQTFLYLSFENGKEMYEVGASYDIATCTLSNMFIHRSIRAKADSGDEEWIPSSTLSKENIPRSFFSPFYHNLKQVVEALPKDKKQYQNTHLPLPFLLVANGKVGQTNDQTRYTWVDKESGISLEGIDRDNNGILDSLFLSKERFTYEDITADGISAGDRQYIGERPSSTAFRPQQIIGSPLHQNFYVGAKHVRGLTRIVEKRMRR